MGGGTVLKRLFAYVKKNTLLLLLGFFFSVVSVGLSLYIPIVVGQAIDAMIGAGKVQFDLVLQKLIIILVSIVISTICQWLMTLCMNKVTYLSIYMLRREVFYKINALPLSYIDSHSRGDLLSRMVTDMEQISDGMVQGLTQLFNGVVTVVVTIVFMLTISVPTTLIVIVLTPLSMLFAAVIAKNTSKMVAKQNQLRGELSGYAEEIIGGAKTMKAFGYEEEAQEKFADINHRLKRYGFLSQFYPSISNPGTRLVNGFVYTAVGVYGAVSALAGTLTIGQVSSFLTYANQYTKPFNEITSVMAELQNAVASGARIFHLLDAENETSDANLPELIPHEGKVTFSDVAFSYRPEQKLIRNFNVVAEYGQRIALVGPTGCGKTTLINLIMRFYDVDKGEILIDDTPITQVTRKSLRSQFGMVLQDSWLFTGTIRENIAYGKPDASEEEIIAAAKLARAHYFIQRMEKGYDTLISEDAGNLSAGQKQLLCIARIMLMKPPMLILDEATSNIDTRTEIQVQKAFDTLLSGKTSFVVAHRLSTIQTADVILVMKAGEIIERGTHEELMAQNGFYHNLYNSQFENSTPISNAI